MVRHIIVIGATGATGQEVVKQALKKGYNVTVLVRKYGSIKPAKNLNVVIGDVTNSSNLITAFSNADAVISCFGPSKGRKAGTIMSTGAKNIVAACENAGVKRLVFMSGILQSDGKELTFLNRLGIKFFRSFYKEAYKDKVIAETSIQTSKLNWVIVRAAGLKNALERGSYTAGLARISPFTLLPYSDCAACLVDAVEDSSWTGQIINVGQ